MKKVIYISLAALILHTYAYGAFEFKEAGAQGVALSGACSGRAGGATAPYWNPAALGLLRYTEIASFFSKPFSMEELNYFGPAFALPTPIGGVGLAYNQFGTPAYREQQIYFSHGLKIMDNIHAGYNLKGMFLKIEDFGSAAAFGLDMGIIAKIRENVHIAVTAKNLNHPSIGVSKEPIPASFAAGAAFRPIAGLWLTSEIERINPKPISIKNGMEFMLAPYFTLRGGFRNNFSGFSGGFGAQAGIIKVDYAYSFNSNLSGSHQFTVSFRFGEIKEEFYKFSSIAFTKSAQAGPVSAESNGPERKFNLNNATEEELISIRKVGKVTAKNIIDYRTQFGFKNLDDLLKVPKMRRDTFFSLKERTYLPIFHNRKDFEPYESPFGLGVSLFISSAPAAQSLITLPAISSATASQNEGEFIEGERAGSKTKGKSRINSKRK